MASQALGFAELLGGGILATMGITGFGIRDVIGGRANSIKPLAGGGAAAGAGGGGAPPGLQGPVTGEGAKGKKTRGQRIAMLKKLIELFPGLTISEGPGFGGATPGVHTGSSLHYSGLAYDINADSASKGERWVLTKLFNLLPRLFPGEINELFYDPIGYYLDQGKKVQGSIGEHGDHLHIGFFPAVGE